MYNLLISESLPITNEVVSELIEITSVEDIHSSGLLRVPELSESLNRLLGESLSDELISNLNLMNAVSSVHGLRLDFFKNNLGTELVEGSILLTKDNVLTHMIEDTLTREELIVLRDNILSFIPPYLELETISTLFNKYINYEVLDPINIFYEDTLIDLLLELGYKVIQYGTFSTID